MSLIKHIEIPNGLCLGIHQTGSSVICNPPVTDTDIDYVIYTNEQDKLDTFLKCGGFKKSCADEEEYDLKKEGFTCYRRENINLIVINDRKWYKCWVLATKVAKSLNLKVKADRVMLFRAFLYDEAPY